LPIDAVSPLTHGVSTPPLAQLESVVVFQFPLPSVTAPGLVPLASQFKVWAADVWERSAATTGASADAISFALRMFHSPLRWRSLAQNPVTARKGDVLSAIRLIAVKV
jgi:hypothetical protein